MSDNHSENLAVQSLDDNGSLEDNQFTFTDNPMNAQVSSAVNDNKHINDPKLKHSVSMADTNKEEEQVIRFSKLWWRNILDHPIVTTIMTILTLYALYGDDIRLKVCTKDADDMFMWISFIAFLLFLLELSVSSFAKPGYLFHEATDESNELPILKRFWKRLNISFYFILDLVATASLILEIKFLNDAIFQKDDGTSNADELQSARAGRASRAGARAGRIVRVIRMVRLIRLAKLYKYANNDQCAMCLRSNKTDPMEAENIEKGEKSTMVDEDDEDEDYGLGDESHVGAAMSDLTTRRVIVGVLSMLVIIPLLSYAEQDRSQPFAVNLLNHFYVNDLNNVDNGIDILKEAYGNKILQIKIDGETRYNLENTDIKDYREGSELSIFVSGVDKANGNNNVIEIIYNIKEISELDAVNNMLLTTFVICLFALGTFAFSTDVNRLVILPIEKMVKNVQEISKNPLGYDFKGSQDKEDGFADGMETTLLLQTINKIGELMKVGFGEAGADIIAKNLQASDDFKLNLLTSGNLINSIFGFCDIRNFTDTTECLQEEVMLFVNRIANVLHSIVVDCGGAANKNIGDAFLLTWKLDNYKHGEKVKKEHSELADRALHSFLKFTVEMNRHQEFVCDFTVAATQRLYKRMPGYKVRMGYGLHFGWAVEGAIGSAKKIDASYISPHVNMSEFLESSTKEYGVCLLMSEPFYNLLSKQAKRYIRQVDNIKKSETDDVTGLYTYDCDLDANFIVQKVHKDTSQENKKNMKTRRRGSNGRRNSVEKKKGKQASGEEDEDSTPKVVIPNYTPDMWEDDRELQILRRRIDQLFRTQWEEGIKAYIAGDWEKAVDMFKGTYERSKESDKASMLLIEYMESYGCKKPDDWKGYRKHY